jgi:sporadic carbohydrate cluster 2OG-Fe(II) oxygenase
MSTKRSSLSLVQPAEEQVANNSFFPAAEKPLIEAFLKNGIVTIDVENKAALDRMQQFLAETAASLLKLPKPTDAEAFLNAAHRHVSVEELNSFRLNIISAMKKETWYREAYYSLAATALATLVGNELAMQRGVNLSIQLPDDTSSLLPLHSDVWSGDSPYEVVLWVPYVSCYKTKSMYFCNAEADERVQSKLAELKDKTADDLYNHIAADAPFMDVPYGKAMIFTQNIMHGNRVNIEPETRWSSNCRFKSVLSPYADKKLGEFFEPITLRPTTRLGLRYQLPTGFKE